MDKKNPHLSTSQRIMLLIYIYLPEVSSYAICMFTFLLWNIVNNYNSLCNCQFFIFMYMCLIFVGTRFVGASLVAQTVRNMPAIQETRVQSLGSEDSLEKGMATHSSILAWRTPWTEELGWLRSIGSQSVGHNWATKHSTAHDKFKKFQECSLKYIMQNRISYNSTNFTIILP